MVVYPLSDLLGAVCRLTDLLTEIGELRYGKTEEVVLHKTKVRAFCLTPYRKPLLGGGVQSFQYRVSDVNCAVNHVLRVHAEHEVDLLLFGNGSHRHLDVRN